MEHLGISHIVVKDTWSRYFLIYEAIILFLFLAQGTNDHAVLADLYIIICAFPTLLFLLAIEKNPNKPYAFVTPAKPIWLGIGSVICIATPWIVSPLVYTVWFHQLIIWPNVLKNAIYDILNPILIAIELHVALSEESIKVALINSFGWRASKMEPRKRQLWMIVVMMGSVGLWAVGHIFYGGYDLENIIAAFIVGLIWAIVVYRLKNFAPAVVGHMLWNLFLL